MSSRQSSSIRVPLWLAVALAIAITAGAAWFITTGQNAGSDRLAEQNPAPVDRPIGKLGLMTSLPLYWPLGAEFGDLASGQGEVPWQREAMERRFELVPLDTLSPIAGLTQDEPETDPLRGLEYLGVIQPRGLSPADNVALDDWVGNGGKLLLVLDPTLTGEYDLPLGDPRRPVDSALIPPVVARWGMRVQFAQYEVWEEGIFGVVHPRGSMIVSHGGTIEITDPEAAQCTVLASETIARCFVGDGQVTMVADAAVFEDPVAAGEDGSGLLGILDYAFE